MGNLYPVGYGTQMLTLDALKARFTPHMHPEAARRGFAFIESQKGLFGIGGGYRSPGLQPNAPGYAPPGHSFHEGQPFPSGLYYCAWDMVCASPGNNHRTPKWSEVPYQGSQMAIDFGWHMNVGAVGMNNSEPWHAQPIELDGWDAWDRAGRKDLQINYPVKYLLPKPPPKPPTPPVSQGDDMQVRLLILEDSDAQFLAQTDDEGQALIITWAGPGSPQVDRAVAAHRAEALRKGHQFEQDADIAGVYNCVYFGDTLPYGDRKHDWKKSDFWRTVGVA